MYADASVPEATAKKVHGKKKVGKQKENVSRLPLRVQNHELLEEELVSVFGENGWKRLPDKVYLKVEYLPARQECVEHHIAIYAGVRKEDRQKTVVQAPHPVEVIEKSLATSSLIACIMNMKYVNAIPLYRMEQEFARNDLVISRANMANWIIYSTEHYFSLMYRSTGRKSIGRVKVLIFAGTRWQTGLSAVPNDSFPYGMPSGKNFWNATL